MYALYAYRDGMANIFIRTFPRLDMMDSNTIEQGSGAVKLDGPAFPESYEPFALNLKTGEVLWFADEWEEVQNDIRAEFLSSFSCSVDEEDDYIESEDPHIPSDDDLQFSFRNHEE